MYSHEDYEREHRRRERELQEENYLQQMAYEEMQRLEYERHIRRQHDEAIEYDAKLFEIINLLECTIVQLHELD